MTTPNQEETMRITFNHRLNLDDLGQAAKLATQYAAASIEAEQMAADEGVALIWKGRQHELPSEEVSEELCSELSALFNAHVGARPGFEVELYRLLARALSMIDDYAVARGAIPPSELVDA